jgi:hypothetical protein
VTDAFVDRLDLGELGFEGVEPAETGRPAYHPSVLLKLYVYGYPNRVQSSWQLEADFFREILATLDLLDPGSRRGAQPPQVTLASNSKIPGDRLPSGNGLPGFWRFRSSGRNPPSRRRR